MTIDDLLVPELFTDEALSTPEGIRRARESLLTAREGCKLDHELTKDCHERVTKEWREWVTVIQAQRWKHPELSNN